MAAPRKLTSENVNEFLDSFDVLFTDCDGVIWLTDFDSIPNASRTLDLLRERGKRVYFATNNGMKSRQDLLNKFQRLGFKTSANEIVCTAYAAAAYLKSINFNKTVYMIGSEGLAKELDLAGIRHIGLGPGPEVPKDLFQWLNYGVNLDPEVGAVIVGFDKYFSYYKITLAVSYLNKPGMLFIATNTDERFPLESETVIVPGTGCIVRSVATGALREPLVLGKPSPYMFEGVQKIDNVNPARCIMIGDRLNTDIQFGKACKMASTLLVLTGVATLDDVRAAVDSGQHQLVPDYYIDSLGDLAALLSTTNHTQSA